ncbi:DUF1566 domain-containing protein [Deltaproteobacteria bacterium TL4]
MKNQQFTNLFFLLLFMLGVIPSCLQDEYFDQEPTPIPGALGFDISPISNKTSETGTYATFTVKLKQIPTHDVVLPVSSSKVTEGTVSTSQLTFTAENWSTQQIVMVTGVDDSVADGEKRYAVILGTVVTKDADYQTLNPDDVKVVNVDDDSPGFTVGPISGKTSESGQTASFTVQIHSQPTADVIVPLASDNAAEGVILQKELRFTPDNWETPQTATVQGVDDAAADGNQRYHIVLSAAVSEDTVYKGMDPEDVQVENIDNETPGITVSAVSGNTNEFGETATFTVRLNVAPTAEVTLSLSSGDTTEVTVFPQTLTFTPLNWNAPQTVTLTGIDDSEEDGNQRVSILFGNTTSQDPGYHQLSLESVTVINEDNELPGFRISALSGLTTEKGGTATFTIKINTEPTGDVVVAIVSTDPSEGSVSPSSLIFTSDNWNANQTVTVTGVNDDVIDGNQSYTIQLTLNTVGTLDNSGYALLPPSTVSVTNIDDDHPGFTISAISGNTAEDGSSASFTVKLMYEPTGNVVIDVATSDTTEGTVSTASLTFTSTNWNANQTITVTGVNDDIADGNQSFTIQLTINTKATTDISGYSALNPDDVAVTNTDLGESAGFIISVISGNTSEAGGTATFTVKLTSEPTANVVIDVVTSDVTEGTVSPSSITFSSTNWNANQTITVTGVNDDIADGNQSYTVQLTLNTGNTLDTSGYASLNPDDVAVTNTDNDSPGFVISAISGNTTEAGGTATFTVKLNSQPTANVVLSVVSSKTAEGTVSPASLTYTASDWNTNQTVIVTGVDDAVQDGNITYTISVSLSSTSDTSGYGSLAASLVSVTNADNDAAPTVTATSVAFTDTDGRWGRVGGDVTISKASDESNISHYTLYWGSSSTTKQSETAITQITANGSATYTYTFSSNTVLPSLATSLLAFSMNNWGESSSAASVGINDYQAIPDTGQTTSYTTTFGEDHDYTQNTPSYTDNGNSTITDNVTGLMWQKEDNNSTYTWSAAGTYCDNLSLGGYTDWTLPNRRQLISIVNVGRYNPAINTTYFLNTKSSYYWSSTTYANDTSYAWYVYFGYGRVNYSNKTSTYYVRCVRGGQ